MLRTPLYELHKESGASFVEFAGWEMPISYSGIKEEHAAVRNSAGLFDVSHMGDIWIEGKDATPFLSKMLTMNPATKKAGECIYAHILGNDGMIMDDTIVIKMSENQYLFVPNAATKDEMISWFSDNSKGMDVQLIDKTVEYSCIAFQGPRANEFLQEISDIDLKELKFFRAKRVSYKNGKIVEELSVASNEYLSSGEVIISRTGYTGEDGFELISLGEEGRNLWKTLAENGADKGVKPIGLGARDTLRLEKGFLLSGTDFNKDRTPLETGWDFVLEWDHDFIGKDVVEKVKETPYPKLKGLVLEGKAIPRHDMNVIYEDEVVGTITSGSFSPMLEKGIALAYLPPTIKKGTSVEVEIRGKRKPAMVVKPPFVK